MQKVTLDTVQTEITNGVVRNVSKKSNHYYFTCDSTEKVENLPNISKSEILDVNVQMSGKRINEGDLIIVGVNFGVDIYAKINEKGELIIFGKNADRYSINSLGELIYTYCNE